jgi:hypothetical protein
MHRKQAVIGGNAILLRARLILHKFVHLALRNRCAEAKMILGQIASRRGNAMKLSLMIAIVAVSVGLASGANAICCCRDGTAGGKGGDCRLHGGVAVPRKHAEHGSGGNSQNNGSSNKNGIDATKTKPKPNQQ